MEKEFLWDCIWYKLYTCAAELGEATIQNFQTWFFGTGLGLAVNSVPPIGVHHIARCHGLPIAKPIRIYKESLNTRHYTSVHSFLFLMGRKE